MTITSKKLMFRRMYLVENEETNKAAEGQRKKSYNNVNAN